MKKFVARHPVQLSAAWAALIFVLCAVPGRFVPSAGWMELLGFDKLVHAGMFCVLGWLMILSAKQRRIPRRIIVGLLLLAVCYGILLEVMQAALFSGRSMEVLDAMANTAGVAVSAMWLRGSKVI